MAQVPLHCSCASSSTVQSIRVSLVSINPVYGAVRVCATPVSDGVVLERVAKPTDIPTGSPEVLVELMDQTRRCTLACIAWSDKAGTVFPCSDIREIVVQQGGYASSPKPGSGGFQRRD